MWGIDALLAIDAGEVAKLDTRGQPSFLQPLHEAVHVCYVSTLDHHAWCNIQSFRIAYGAVIFPSFASCVIRVLLHAIWVKAGKTLKLPFKATAIVAAREDLLAGVVHQGDAVSRSAHLLESWYHRR